MRSPQHWSQSNLVLLIRCDWCRCWQIYHSRPKDVRVCVLCFTFFFTFVFTSLNLKSIYSIVLVQNKLKHNVLSHVNSFPIPIFFPFPIYNDQSEEHTTMPLMMTYQLTTGLENRKSWHIHSDRCTSLAETQGCLWTSI